MYHFVELDDGQKALRRQLLDTYAFYAQISVLLPLGVCQCWTWTSRWRRKSAQRQHDLRPSSPYLKDTSHDVSGLENLAARLRKLDWWLGDDFDTAGRISGTRGQVFAVATWASWLLLLCFLQTGDDYLHLTKRFGIVAASQFPLHYLLAWKSPYSPLQYITKSSHETLIVYHQLLGRVITLLLYGHGALYLNFYIQKSILATKFCEFYVIAGILGVLAFTALTTTALPQIRRWKYRAFYVTHVLLASLLLLILWFHVTHIRKYLYQSIAIYNLHTFLRRKNTAEVDATVRRLPGTNLLEVSIPIPPTSDIRGYLSKYSPAQHAYLSLPGSWADRAFRSNPFTIASLPKIDGYLCMYTRVLSGNTVDLDRCAHPRAVQQLFLEGPYGVQTHPERLVSYDRILMVAGGIGGTFIVPLYRQLLADLDARGEGNRKQRVKLIWVVKSIEEMSWALPELEQERSTFVEGLGVFVTGAPTGTSRTSRPDALPTKTNDDEGELIELQQRRSLLSTPELEEGSNAFRQPSGSQAKASIPAYTPGRPNLRRIVDATFSHSTTERVAVVVCGPDALRKDLRRELGRWVMGSAPDRGFRKGRGKGREVWWWGEGFGL